ncbi:MAG: DUF975 family protein [Ruminococcaceae bacterium]|nr:DUF975 family protein [Oscillospiraceae bacterium]
MQPTFYEIKKASRNALSTRWPEAILVFVSFCAVSLLNSVSQAVLMHLFKVESLWSPFTPAELPDLSVIASIGITAFSALFSFIITCPFLLGILKWFWSVTGGSNAHLSEIFYFFSRGALYQKAVFWGLLMFLRISVMAIVCFLPYIVANILTSPAFYIVLGVETPIFVSGLFHMVDILQGLGIVAVAVLNMKHLTFPAVLFTDPQLSAAQSIKRARAVSHREPLRLISFVFSFAGWFFISIFIVPLIFTGPYFISSLCIYGREALREYEQKKKI